jgi:hypothetical protein
VGSVHAHPYGNEVAKEAARSAADLACVIPVGYSVSGWIAPKLAAREALLWKLDGLAEYDVRRPLTPTGTNLLGLVKHLAGVELWYFGDAFGRPPGERPWSADDARNNADFWATADESRDQIAGMYRQA